MINKNRRADPILQDTKDYKPNPRQNSRKHPQYDNPKSDEYVPERNHKKYKQIITDVLNNNPNIKDPNQPNFQRVKLRNMQEKYKKVYLLSI